MPNLWRHGQTTSNPRKY